MATLPVCIKLRPFLLGYVIMVCHFLSAPRISKYSFAEKLYTLVTANQDIIDTIIDAMNQPRRRAKAVTFLERIAKDGEMCVCILQFQPTERPENIGYACQLMLNISLLDKIAKLGKNIIRKKSPCPFRACLGLPSLQLARKLS